MCVHFLCESLTTSQASFNYAVYGNVCRHTGMHLSYIGQHSNIIHHFVMHLTALSLFTTLSVSHQQTANEIEKNAFGQRYIHQMIFLI